MDVRTPPFTEQLYPQQSAACAGLTYVSDETPGVRRRQAGKDFAYRRPDAAPVTGAATLARSRKPGMLIYPVQCRTGASTAATQARSRSYPAAFG